MEEAGKKRREKGYYEEHAGLLRPQLPAIFRHYEVCRGERKDFLHWHEGIELFFGKKGEGQVFCDGLTFDLEPGNVVLVNSGQLHMAQARSERVEYEYLILEQPFWEENGLALLPWFSCQRRVGDEKMERLMEAAVQARQGKGDYAWLELKGVLLQIMAHLLENYGTEGETGREKRNGQKGRQRMQAALVYLKEHYREPVTVAQVSGAAGFSPSHFSRQFKEMSGMTLMEYVNMLRCDGVRRILLTENCSIQQAAEQCGFTNMAHFYRMYRRFVGHLPSVEARSWDSAFR